MRTRRFSSFIPLWFAWATWTSLPALGSQSSAPAVSMARPRAGRPAILPVAQLRPGMQAVAWTVFSGMEPEPVPIEIVGVMKNAWGPKQDIIIGKMGGKAQRTNVAGGMSGSPVYIDGKLIGAVSLRLSVFSPDAICGITPIELMLEINEYDQSAPPEARTPDKAARRAHLDVPAGFSQAASAGLTMTPIDTPLFFAGFDQSVIREFAPMFQQMGVTAAQGGASAVIGTAKPAAGWQNALNPGEAVSGVLVSGDMSMTAMGTVTYNDGKRVLAFGHPFLSLGNVSMPMAQSEVVMTLASSYQPNKVGNATAIAGALKQDRHAGIMGVLGEQSDMIPCRVKVRSFTGAGQILKERVLRFQVFVQQRWTPFLMMATLFNSVSQLNDFSEEATYRFTGNVELDGGQKISLTNLFAPAEAPVPVPMIVAGWWGDKFTRLFSNPVSMPRLKNVDVTLDLLPQRRIAVIETAFAEKSEADAGSEVPVRVVLRPYRGGRIERQIVVRIPAGYPKGDHRILLSDADALNRLQLDAGKMNRFMDLPETVSLLNQERTNDKLYVSLIQARPTMYYDDKTLPALPASVANVMQTGRSASRAVFQTPETADLVQALEFDSQVTGSYSLRIRVK